MAANMNEQEQDGSIIINLDRLESTEVRGRGELIFRDQFEELVRKISGKAAQNIQLLEKAESAQPSAQKTDDINRGVPTCFFIDGPRGSGKSTLMRSVRDALLNGNVSQTDVYTGGLYPLADIDPTELGKGENFFLFLLGRIYKLLEENFNKRASNDDEVEKIRLAMDDLRKMSSGMQLLMDSDEALKRTENPDAFLENCVDRCADSMLLRKRLCALLGKLSQIVRKKIFLVTIDDADLNFSKCEDVLEYIRKYMQSPRLIFLFAGDMQLYSHVVRGMQIKSFNEQQLRYDISHLAHRGTMLDCMESQYLLKLFPADNRVKMPTLGELLNSGKNSLAITYNGVEQMFNHKKRVSFYPFIRKYIFPIYGYRTPKVADALLHALSLRSILFLMQDWLRATWGIASRSEEFVKSVSDCLQRISASAMVKFNVNYTSLDGHNTPDFVNTLINHFTRTKIWKTDLGFSPSGGNVDELLLTVYLGSVVTATTQKMSEKLLYLCTLYPQQYRLTELYADAFERGEVGPTMRVTSDYSELGAVACACTAPLVPSGSNYTRRFGAGVIRLMQDAQVQDKEKGTWKRISFSALARQISDSVSRGNETLLGLGIANTICSVQERAEKSYYISLYNLILSMAEWLEAGSRVLQGVEPDAKVLSAEKLEELRDEVKQRLSFPVISSNASRENAKHDASSVPNKEDDDAEENQEYFIVQGAQEKDDDIVDEYVDWLMMYARMSFPTPPEMYSVCWRRFMWRCEAETKSYALRFSDAEKAPRAGVLLKAYMRAFEDAVVESFSPSPRSENRIIACLRNFPLWRALSEAEESESQLYQTLNEVNVGSLRDYGYIEVVRSAQEQLTNKTNALEEAEKALSALEITFNKTQDAMRSAYDQWYKEKAKVAGLDKNETDFSKQETSAEQYLQELHQRIGQLWDDTKTCEMKIAELEATQHGNKIIPEIRELEKSMARKRGMLKRRLTESTKERLMLEVQEIQQKIDVLTAQYNLLGSDEQRGQLASQRALLRVLKEQRIVTQQEIYDAQRTLSTAQKNAVKARKDLYIAQEECNRLEEICRRRDEEVREITEKKEQAENSVKQARSEREAANAALLACK